MPMALSMDDILATCLESSCLLPLIGPSTTTMTSLKNVNRVINAATANALLLPNVISDVVVLAIDMDSDTLIEECAVCGETKEVNRYMDTDFNITALVCRDCGNMSDDEGIPLIEKCFICAKETEVNRYMDANGNVTLLVCRDCDTF